VLRSVVLAAVCCAAFGGCVDVAEDDGCRASAVAVTSFTVGDGGGFGAERLPGVIAGDAAAAVDSKGGTLDVVSLGDGGVIVVEVGCAIADHADDDDDDGDDGGGVDFVVHENPFVIGDGPLINTEAGIVGVSADGETFVDFACDGAEYEDDGPGGCAGMTPGGDEFDLAALDLAGIDGDIRFVRIVDRGGHGGGEGKAGFDLDAVVVVSTDE